MKSPTRYGSFVEVPGTVFKQPEASQRHKTDSGIHEQYWTSTHLTYMPLPL